MNFQLTDQRMTVASVTPHAEMHGSEPEPALAVKLEAHLPNDFLNQLADGMKAALYMLDEARLTDLADAGSAADPNFMPHLRFPSFDISVRSTGTMQDARVVIAVPGDQNGMVLEGCKIDKLAIERLDGGTIGVSFMVHAHPPVEMYGQLGVLVRHEVQVTITSGGAA